ncbi:Lrp/AsnC family transcriptional regulator [Actinomadura sp. 6N118]|uniref:Lrp/AsnC family transcriptional regulator n=1 Tax=Actinomadura sp. 6N118 TaxID=3375151 RepID=UPI0037B319AB
MSVDDLDEKIIACLVEDARSTYADIGSRIGLSAPAVKRRVDRLRVVGVIKGFTAVVDRGVQGPRIEAFVELSCAGGTSAHDLCAALAVLPEVADVRTVAGEADALVRLLAPDMSRLDRVLEHIRNEPRVVQTRSIIVLSRLMERPTPTDLANKTRMADTA